MMYRIFAAALAAGLLAAALITVVEIFTTTPMIVAAENYEPPEMHAPEAANAGAHEHDAQAWEPEGDLQRFLFTALANAVMGIAFALLLVVGLTYSEGEPDRKQGITLAAIGFAAFTLAPAMGLPPKLPGMPVADLYDRQYWWIATALLTLLGLLSLYLSPKVVVKLLGVVLVIAPHVWGRRNRTTWTPTFPPRWRPTSPPTAWSWARSYGRRWAPLHRISTRTSSRKTRFKPHARTARIKPRRISRRGLSFAHKSGTVAP